jgi:excisionase family DNA binding protein
VLCVDDEPLVLEGLRDVLARNFDVRMARGGREALELLEQDRNGYAVVISDMRMPGMSGASFLREARHTAPLAVRMLLTGHADTGAAVRAVNDGQIFRFLTKPCPSDELNHACTAAARQHRQMTAERVLIEQTMDGSIKALTEALALTTAAGLGQPADLEPKRDRSQLSDQAALEDGPPVAPTREHEPAMTLSEAADALELSTSTLRRWADAGRIHAIRTSGGHRRFPTREVRRLQAARHRPKVRSMPPPVAPLPALSDLLATAAPNVAAASTQALYDGAHTGWFASTTGRQQLERWALGVAAGARNGTYDTTTDATRTLMLQAAHAGASLLERYTILERAGGIIVRELQTRGTDRAQLLGARRLLVHLRQLVLETDDPRD